jgi:hypothetical protein
MNGGSDSTGAEYVCIAVDVEAVLQLVGKADDAESGDASPQLIAASGADVIATSTARLHSPDITARLPHALIIAAHVGDLLRIYAVSGSNNFESAVLLDDVSVESKSVSPDVVSAFTFEVFEQIPVTPSAEPLTFADDSEEAEFWFWQATIEGAGTQQCHAVLALYGRDDQGQPSFAGLYRWDFKLTVKLKETSDQQQTEGVA